MRITRLFWFVLLFMSVACSKENDSSPPGRPETPVSAEILDPLLIDAAQTNLMETDAARVMQLFLCRESPVQATRASFADKAVENTFSIDGDAGEPLAYVVNYAGGGYGIVSATKKYAPILAFSDEGCLTPALLAGNGIAMWVASITADIADTKATLAEDSPEYAEVRTEWREYEKPETPVYLAATMQDANYWYLKLRSQMMADVGYCTSNRLMFFPTAFGYGAGLDRERMERELQETDRVLKIEYGVLDAPPALIWGDGLMSESETKVMPLLRTYWHQFFPYNELIEMRDSGPSPIYGARKPAGCVAIAVAQILNYYRYPDQFRLAAGAGFFTVEPIDWSKTQEKFAGDNNEEIPRLVWIVNRGVFTRNRDDGSSSNIDNAQSFLSQSGYAARIHSGPEVDRIMRDEIMQGRPVYVRGDKSSEEAGHAWVCDGYYSKDFQYRMLAYQLTCNEKKHFPENPYCKILELSRISRSGEFFHMNWGWENRQYIDESDPSTLREETNGWYRSVFNNKPGYDDIRILQIIKK